MNESYIQWLAYNMTKVAISIQTERSSNEATESNMKIKKQKKKEKDIYK